MGGWSDAISWRSSIKIWGDKSLHGVLYTVKTRHGESGVYKGKIERKRTFARSTHIHLIVKIWNVIRLVICSTQSLVWSLSYGLQLTHGTAVRTQTRGIVLVVAELPLASSNPVMKIVNDVLQFDFTINLIHSRSLSDNFEVSLLGVKF